MNRKFFPALALLSLIVLSGCGFPFKLSTSAKTHYEITAKLAEAPAVKASHQRLALREVLSSGFVDSHRILFTKSVGQIGSYQYASWVEVPAKQLTDLLLFSLQRSNLYSAVTRVTSGAVVDLQLNSELREFVHDATESSTKVRIVMSCELVDLETRDISASKVFEVVEPVDSNNADGAVEGFGRATARLLQEITDWLAATKR